MKGTYWILIFVVVTNFFSQILFAEIAKGLEFTKLSIESISSIVLTLITDPKFWVSLFFFGSSALLWILGLKKIALAKAFSITSLNYILIFLYSITILNEEITLSKVTSCLFIIGGVLLIAQNELVTIYLKTKRV